MKITVCIGSSCHLKGSRQVVNRIEELIAQNNLGDKLELSGAFCMANCQKGVSVKWNDQIYSLSEDSVDSFFKNEVLTEL